MDIEKLRDSIEKILKILGIAPSTGLIILLIIISYITLKHKGIFSLYTFLKDIKLNRYKKYGSDYLSRHKNDSNSFINSYINRQMDIIQLHQLSDIKNEYNQNLFMYLNSEIIKCNIPKHNLKKIIKYISPRIDTFSIDYEKAFSDKLKYSILFLLFLVMMLFACFLPIFVFYFWTPNEINLTLFKAIWLTSPLIFEVLSIYFYDKLPSKNNIEKYNKELINISSIEFKDYIEKNKIKR